MPSFRDFYFDSSTGHNKLRAHMCTPDMQPKAVVQIVHGIAEHMDRYDDFMLFLASNGFLVVGDDHLGHGKSIDKPEDIGFFAERNGWTYAVQDEEILRSAMKINYPDIPIIVFGHSMGSFLTRTHLIKFPGGFDAAMSLLEGDKCSLTFYVDEEVLATVKTFRLGTTLKDNPDALKKRYPRWPGHQR